MNKFSKYLLLIIVCITFFLMDKYFTGIWHAIFEGVMIGWASVFFVISIDKIVN